MDAARARSTVDLVVGVDNPQRLHAVTSAELQGHLDDPDLYAVVRTLQLTCDVPIAVVNIVTPNLQTYTVEVGVGQPCTTVPDTVSFCAEVVDTGLPLVVSEAAVHPVYRHNPLVLAGVVGAYAGFPLVDSGVVLGSVAVFDVSPRQFSADVLEVLAHQTELAAAVLTLRRQASRDVLTGLANRERLLSRLGLAVARLDRRRGMAGVLYFDVDDFKDINDKAGHRMGDGVLVELGHRLLRVLRPTDIVSRFGGDEFVAVCEDLGSIDDAEAVVARVAAALDAPWVVDGRRLQVEVSIGCAVTSSPTTSPDQLLHDADAAMYLAKESPRVRSSVVVSEQAHPLRRHPD